MECGRSLAPISASSIDPKRIPTPHSIFREFGADTPFTLVGQASKFEHLPVIWQSLLTAISEDNRRFRLKSIAKLLGQRFVRAYAGWISRH